MQGRNRFRSTRSKKSNSNSNYKKIFTVWSTEKFWFQYLLLLFSQQFSMKSSKCWITSKLVLFDKEFSPLYAKQWKRRHWILSHCRSMAIERKSFEWISVYESGNYLVHRHRERWLFVSKGWCLVVVSDNFQKAQWSEFEFTWSWRKPHHNLAKIKSI